MAEIDFLLVEQEAEGKNTRRVKRAVCETIQWHGFLVQVHRITEGWLYKPHHLYAYLKKQREQGRSLWTDKCLDGILKGYSQPFPTVEFALFLLQNQPFREIMILNGTGENDNGRFWTEKFLESSFAQLNGLYLCGNTQADEAFLEYMYRESGLLAVQTLKTPQADGKKCVYVDLNRKGAADYRKLPRGCLYLDLTSDIEKQRCLSVKRHDISYVSARNYLDTALKVRYNAV